MARLVPLLALVALLPAVGRGDDSIRCDGGVVSVGDSKLDLLGKCGEPVYREAKIEERGAWIRGEPKGATAGETVTVSVERWTFDFGPQRFSGIVTIEATRVVAVEYGSRGRELQPAPARVVIPRARCDYAAFHVGDRAWEILSRCGEPAVREQRELTRSMARSLEGPRKEGERPARRAGEVASTTTSLETWSYDFGPNVLVRHLELEDGVVVRVTTGGHGYSEP
jgi:hypothetical protein